MTEPIKIEHDYPEVRSAASLIAWAINKILKDRFGISEPQSNFIPVSLLSEVFTLLEWLSAVIHDDWAGENQLTEIIHEAQEFGIPDIIKTDDFERRWKWFVALLKETGSNQNIKFEIRQAREQKGFTKEEIRSKFVSFGIEYGYLDLEYYRYFDVKNCRKKTLFERLFKRFG